MTQLATLMRHEAAITEAGAEIARVLSLMDASPYAAPAVTAERAEIIATELATIRRHAERAEVIARTILHTCRAAEPTYCHARPRLIEHAPASSPMADKA